ISFEIENDIVGLYRMVFGGSVRVVRNLDRNRRSSPSADDGDHEPCLAHCRALWRPPGAVGLSCLWPREQSEFRQTSRQGRRAGFASIAKGTTHCGAGCTLGDVIAEIMLAALPMASAAL